jgi:hypothetical protein
LGCVAVCGLPFVVFGAAVATVGLAVAWVLVSLRPCLHTAPRTATVRQAGRQAGWWFSAKHMCPQCVTELCPCFDVLGVFLNRGLLRHSVECWLLFVAAAGAVRVEEHRHAEGSKRTARVGRWGAPWMLGASVCCCVPCVRLQLALGPGTLAPVAGERQAGGALRQLTTGVEQGKLILSCMHAGRNHGLCSWLCRPCAQYIHIHGICSCKGILLQHVSADPAVLVCCQQQPWTDESGSDPPAILLPSGAWPA